MTTEPNIFEPSSSAHSPASTPTDRAQAIPAVGLFEDPPAHGPGETAATEAGATDLAAPHASPTSVEPDPADVDDPSLETHPRRSRSPRLGGLSGRARPALIGVAAFFLAASLTALLRGGPHPSREAARPAATAPVPAGRDRRPGHTRSRPAATAYPQRFRRHTSRRGQPRVSDGRAFVPSVAVVPSAGHVTPFDSASARSFGPPAYAVEPAAPVGVEFSFEH
jgi:hypothetical protein